MSFFEKLKFYSKMIILNRKNTIVMFIGLGISLGLIGESLTFLYSFQYDAFEDFNRQTPTRQMTITIDSFDVSDVKNSIVSDLNSLINNIITSEGMEDEILRTDLIAERGGILCVEPRESNSSDDFYLIQEYSICAIPNDYFSALESILFNGTIPSKGNQALVVAPRTTIQTSNLSRLGMFPVYVPMLVLPPDPYASVEAGIPAAGNYLNVTGIAATEDYTNYHGTLEQDIKALMEIIGERVIFTRYSTLFDFVSSINYFSGDTFFSYRIAFDLSEIDAFNVPTEISEIKGLGQEFTTELREEDYSVVIYTNLVDLLEEFNEEFLIFQLFGLLFITPIIGMALSLTSYSANLMKRRQKMQVSNMLQRGTSRKEILLILSLQVIETTIAAILIGIMIGFPFAWLMISSNGFLSFSGASIFPAINLVILFSVVGAGFLFSVFVNAKNIWDLSKITTTEAYSATTEKKPVWEKLFLDIVLIVVGIALWLIVNKQLKGSAAYAFAYGFGTTAPICLIIGCILFATRVYPYFVKILAKIGWNSPKL
ncbi:ABC transporter permease, partial [Candidatus Heimdallarchaeota archaeon]